MKTRRHPLVTLAFFVLVLLIAILGSRLWRMIVAPWSIATGGRPTLIGPWSGALELADGTTGMIWLNLVDKVDEMEGYSRPTLGGTAHYCLGSSEGEFAIYGIADRNGNFVDLRFSSYEDNPVWLLYIDDGRWEGQTLTITGRYSFDPTGQHISHSDQTEPVLTMVLQPAEEELSDEALTKQCL